jgi:hypothetical protein
MMASARLPDAPSLEAALVMLDPASAERALVPTLTLRSRALNSDRP